MSSQFEKRKARAEAAIKDKREKIRESDIEAVIAEVGPLPDFSKPENEVFTHEGYDVCLIPGTQKYQAIVFKYDPVTKVVKIVEVLPVQRGVALVYENHKKALRTLIKRK